LDRFKYSQPALNVQVAHGLSQHVGQQVTQQVDQSTLPQSHAVWLGPFQVCAASGSGSGSASYHEETEIGGGKTIWLSPVDGRQQEAAPAKISPKTLQEMDRMSIRLRLDKQEQRTSKGQL
jgi:hypothetical protein